MNCHTQKNSVSIKSEANVHPALTKRMRPIRVEDTEALQKLAFEVSFGITSLPKNHDLLEKKVARSAAAFEHKVVSPQGETYLFLMEDVKSSAVVGCCGIDSQVGYHAPLYFFQQEKRQVERPAVGGSQEITLLSAAKSAPGESSLCALYLTQSERKGGLGRLLSLSRFMYIARNPHRFTKQVTAELRGMITPCGESPFYSTIMEHFIKVPFSEIIHLYSEDKSIVEEALPEHSIYQELLPKDAQASILSLHPNTVPAFELLRREGFLYTNYVDLFDGGPQVACPVDKIRSIRESQFAKVVEITNVVAPPPFHIISNEDDQIKIAMGPLDFKGPNEAIICRHTAEALELECGDMIRWSTTQ